MTGLHPAIEAALRTALDRALAERPPDLVQAMLDNFASPCAEPCTGPGSSGPPAREPVASTPA